LPAGDDPAHADPLLAAAVDSLPPPDGVDLDIRVHSDTPAGSSTGSSAAACVALLGALSALRYGRCDPAEVARAAHRVETERLGQQSGIQDQIAAAHGGVSFIDMDHYPHARVTRVGLPDRLRKELGRRLSLVFVGQSHHSSAVHEMVIRTLEGAGPDAPQLVRLRRLAGRAMQTLASADLRAFGRVMVANTDAQRDLHPGLVGPRHRRIIDIARSQGAWGWKVNGAGGAGGSVTLLHGPDERRQRETLRLIRDADQSFRVIPIRLDDSGLRVWERTDAITDGGGGVRNGKGLVSASLASRP
jgi:D-glycero-alpha-D-manno-heptose-7-phosphate kinase